MKSSLLTIKNLGALKLGALASAVIASSIWIFSRVQDINPAILQDEWIYTVSSRLYSPWAQDLSYDFGNYLFNLIYSSTLLCGDGFYTCAKVMNLVFIQGFILILFAIALRFMPFWGAFVFYVVAVLSPVNIYSSMYLPEPLFFFLLGITLWFVLKAADNPSWITWAYVGIPLAFAHMAKPHALIAAMAIGVYLLFSALEDRPYWKNAVIRASALLGSFVIVRAVVGFAIAGPKSLNIFGAYGGNSAIGEFVAGVASGEANLEAGSSLVGAGAVAGAAGLFPAQLFTHSLVISALLGAAVVAMIIAAIDSVRTKEIKPAHRLAILALIWLIVMVIAIVLFTGWITGAGDDHTTRVLLRYYDYLFPIVILAGVAVAFDKTILENTTAWIRWVAIAPIFILISTAFAGYFGNLTIQIADAPNLAGLVVNQTVVNVTANLMFLTLLVIAFFPKFTIWAMALLIPWTLVGTGFQIQDQYQGFRLADSAADQAGFFVKDYLDTTQIGNVAILATSRFDGRVADFWMQQDSQLEILNPTSVYPVSELPENIDWVLTIGDLSIDVGEVVSTAEGYKLYKLER
jgi:phosphoglycerol transferase